jgi:tetratricopeptide (TPR) repeat protein
LTKRNRLRKKYFRHAGRTSGQPHSRLSLCMIVKNEAGNIGDCLRSVKPAVDEIVVVDTGSTDNTKEVARQLGARVFDFAWCDDFSAARNESIRHATGDYILWLDADDRVDASEVKKLRDLKRGFGFSKDEAYYLVVNSQSPVDGETLFQQLRIFPNVKGARFEGGIHEQIFHILSALGCRLVKTDIVIRHTGYLDPSVILEKSERNLKILMKELEMRPDHLILHYNAARTLSGIGRHTEAIDHIQRITGDEAIRRDDKPFYLAAALLNGKYLADVGRYGEAVSVYRDLCNDFSDEGVLHFCLGQALFLAKDYVGARQALEKSLGFSIEVSLFPVNLDSLHYYQHYTLGECCHQAGENEQARAFFLKSLNYGPKHGESLTALGLMALQNQTYEDAIGHYQKAIEEGMASDQVYSNLGLSFRKLGRSDEAEQALLKALEMNPRRVEALTNLGHLYHERKAYSQAIDPFTRALALVPSLTDVRFALSEIYFRLYELEKLVQECESLRRELGLACDMTLDSFEELSVLFEEMGGGLSRRGRDDLSLMAYRTSFLIYPTKRILDRIVEIANSLNILNACLSYVEEVLSLHRERAQRADSPAGSLTQPL